MRTRMKVAATMAVLALATVLLSGIGVASAKAPETLPPIETNENCEFIANPGNPVCMLPFPDDYYTVSDPSSATGRRVNFKTEGMPANAFGTHIEAAPYNASDGFSPGSVILLKVPGIDTAADVRAMGAVPINHIGQYTKGNAPIVVIDARPGKRWPIWVEIDSTASDPVEGGAGDPPGRQLHLRPPLHRRPAPPHERRRRRPRSAGRLPLLPRQRAIRTGSDQRPPRRTSKKSSRRCNAPASSATTSTSRGTSPSPATPTTAAASSRCATTPSPSSATRNLADGVPQGSLAELPGHERRKRTEPRADRAPGQGHLHGALLPVPELRAGRDDAARRRTARRSRTGPGPPTSTASSPSR